MVNSNNTLRVCVHACASIVDGPSGNEVTAPCEEVMHDSWISDEDRSGEETKVDQHRESACFLLRATELYSLTHDEVDNLHESIQSFVETVSSQLAKRLNDKMPSTIDEEQKSQLLSACHFGDLFTGLKSRLSRGKFYEDEFNYVVQSSYFVSSTNFTFCGCSCIGTN